MQIESDLMLVVRRYGAIDCYLVSCYPLRVLHLNIFPFPLLYAGR